MKNAPVGSSIESVFVLRENGIPIGVFVDQSAAEQWHGRLPSGQYSVTCVPILLEASLPLTATALAWHPAGVGAEKATAGGQDLDTVLEAAVPSAKDLRIAEAHRAIKRARRILKKVASEGAQA